jgi:hypothetical protein
LRFWGKICGTKCDYFIAEGSGEAGADPSDPISADFEARGVAGVN